MGTAHATNGQGIADVESIETKLREEAARLLAEGKADVVVGYAAGTLPLATAPAQAVLGEHLVQVGLAHRAREVGVGAARPAVLPAHPHLAQTLCRAAIGQAFIDEGIFVPEGASARIAITPDAVDAWFYF